MKDLYARKIQTFLRHNKQVIKLTG